MIKTLRSVLLATLAMVGGSVWAQESSSNEATWEASSKDALTTVYVGNDLTLKWEEGGGDMAQKYSDNYVYFYNGNRVTVAGASSDVKLQKIVFKFKTDTKNGLVTCDSNGKNVSTTGITNDNEALTTTWEGEAESVIFRAAQGTGVRYIESITVTYEGSAPVVEKAPELKITQDGIADTYDMDQNSVFVVYYENAGTAAAENAVLKLFVDDNENASKTIGTLNIAATGFWNAKYNLEGLEAGEHQVYLELSADNAEAVKTEAKTVTFTKKAPEATYSITAESVTVPYDATSYAVVAKLQNTSEVDAAEVKVELRKGISEVLATETVATLAAGAEQEVTLTVEQDKFETGTKTYYLYVNDKYLANVEVTFEEAPIEQVFDLAIIGIDGSIDLANETNQVRITVKNNGNQDIADAFVKLYAGEKLLGESTVSAKVEQTGFCYVAVASEGLPAGELAVKAVVEVADDANIEDNTMVATLTVKAVPAPEATFSVSAENVEVEFGAENFEIVATVKNTSDDVNAKAVEVKLLKGITEVETKTIDELAAGAETTVTFTVDEIGEAGKTANYYVQVANKAQAEVVVTFKEEVLPEVKDLAIVEVIGTIDQAQEANSVRVTVENRGNVDITDAAVTLKNGENVLGTATVSAKAGEQSFCMVPVDAASLEAGELAVVATVEVEGDAEPKDNTMEVKLTVKAIPAPEATFSVTAEAVEVEAGAEQYEVAVVVKNTSDVDAENVEVQLYDQATVVATETIAELKAGQETTVTFKLDNTNEPGTKKEMTVIVAKNAGTQVTINFLEPEVEDYVDLAVVAISGEIDLANTTSDVWVFVQNQGTVSVEDAVVTLTAGDQVLTMNVTIGAGKTQICTFAVSSEGLEAGQLEVVATIETEDDVDLENNEFSKSLNVKADETTDIDNIEAAFGQNVKIFTLGGQKVQSLSRGGIYIINGKKVMVK
ncbi:MAG: hypothetical protein IJV45_05720 [Prevotella sp.]|nr:hypothetical protein [Prevotella sp.]